MAIEMKKDLLSDKIRTLADSIGIDTLGFAGASEFSDYAFTSSPRRDRSCFYQMQKQSLLQVFILEG